MQNNQKRIVPLLILLSILIHSSKSLTAPFQYEEDNQSICKSRNTLSYSRVFMIYPNFNFYLTSATCVERERHDGIQLECIAVTARSLPEIFQKSIEKQISTELTQETIVSSIYVKMASITDDADQPSLFENLSCKLFDKDFRSKILFCVGLRRFDFTKQTDKIHNNDYEYMSESYSEYKKRRDKKLRYDL